MAIPLRRRVLVGAATASLAVLSAIVVPGIAGASPLPTSIPPLGVAPAVQEVIHPSGIAILDGRTAIPASLPDDLAMALDQAETLSEQYPSDLGFPWVDRDHNQLVIPTTSAHGQSVAADALSSNPMMSVVSGRVDWVSHNRQLLQDILDQVIGPNADDVVVTADYPDPEHGRVILEVSAAPDAFLYGLAQQFDPSAMAVIVMADPAPTSTASRSADTSPLFGGAVISTGFGTCTDGFSWHDGTHSMMLTAGHCAPNGASHVHTPALDFGTITNASEENWNTGTGTVKMTGQTVYRGDIALIRDYGGATSAYYIYRGGAGSSSAAPVKQMWSRRAQLNDQYCTGGAVTGELCGWIVDQVNANYYYTKTRETARHIVLGLKHGWCMRLGDSGGPTYTVRSDGGVAAKGIISGAAGFGGSDSYSGAFDAPCENVFTDIWDAYYGLPGVLTTSS